MSNVNFCTLNPFTQPNTVTYKEGNLYVTHTTSAWRTSTGSIGVKTGKWYWEAYQISDESGNGFPVGVYDMDTGLFVDKQAGDTPQGQATKGAAYSAYTAYNATTSSIYNGGTETQSTLAKGAATNVWQCALDLDNGKIWFGINNTWHNSGNPATGTNASYSGGQLSDSTVRTWVPITCSYSTSGSEDYPQNFGTDSTFRGRATAGSGADDNGFGNFKYSPPSGFLALCSANLTIPEAIDPSQGNKPADYFDVLTYTGDGGTSTNITGLNFQPDWVLIKNRGQTDGWLNQNSVSGVGVTHEWNDDGPYESETDCITAFNSDGFTVSNDHKVNASTEDYVAYCWKKSTDAGFDIVEYTGNSSTNNVSHSLGASPEVIMMHLKSGTDWDSTMFMSDTVASGEQERVFL